MTPRRLDFLTKSLNIIKGCPRLGKSPAPLFKWIDYLGLTSTFRAYAMGDPSNHLAHTNVV